MIATEYLGKVYSQKTNVVLKNVGEVPKVVLKCKFPATCKPFPAYQLINPSTQMMITSYCETGCQNVSTLTYTWSLYRFFQISPDDVQEKWIQYVNTSYVKGTDTAELTMASAMFTTNPDVKRWKIEFGLTAVSKQNGIANGASSLILQLNQIPYNGTCTVTPDNGTALQTLFTFTCKDWLDKDGTIEKYVFYSSLFGSEIDGNVGQTKTGVLTTKMPQGAEEDEWRMSIYVQIIDNDGGAAYYNFDNQMTIEPNMSRINDLFNGLLGAGDQTEINAMLSGTPQEMTQNMAALSAALNSMSKAANVSRNGKSSIE
jgi:hypothetical protein